MNIDRLMQRIRLGEDSTLEMKQVLFRGGGKVIEPHPDGLSDELAALGNASGGTLILGVDDKTREITGIPLEQLDRVETWLTAICTDRIKPPLDVITRHLELPNADGQPRPVIVAEVPRSLWVLQSANGYFRRVGHAKREFTPDALARLFQQRSQRIRLFMFRDRLEIHSPGALPNTLSLESMTRLSVSRNEVLTSLFGRYYLVDDPQLGKNYLMDRRGFGVEMILRESEQLSGIRPVYETIDDLELCLTIFAASTPVREERS